MNVIQLPHKLKKIITEQSEKSNIEVGFILAGKDNKVEHIFNLTNTANSSTLLHISINEVNTINAHCKNHNIDIIGLFHSHLKSTASPSDTDIKMMKKSNDIFFIYSKLNKNMFAFTYKDKLESIEIVTIDTQKL